MKSSFVLLGLSAVILALVCACSPARSQDVGDHGMPTMPHIHGVTVPDWYDPACCNNRDCRPVQSEDVEEVEPGVWLYRPEHITFKGEQVHPSHDARFHVCSIPYEGDDEDETGESRPDSGFYGFCIYVILGG